MGRDRRVLPHNVEAEASILGGIILRNEVLTHLDTIEVEDFYDNRHKVVFQAVRNLEASARPIDIVTLENEIAKAGKLEAIGGVAFLGELTLRVPTVDNVVAYAEIVTDKHQARKLMLAAGEISEKGYEDGLLPQPRRGDFPAFGKSYRHLDDRQQALATSIAAERHVALAWLNGLSEDWDSTPTDT